MTDWHTRAQDGTPQCPHCKSMMVGVTEATGPGPGGVTYVHEHSLCLSCRTVFYTPEQQAAHERILRRLGAT